MSEHRSSSSSSASSSLAPAVLDVLRGAARGESITDTARRRVVSPHTVKTQRRVAIRELGARNVTHAVAIVMRQERDG